jgi:PAS domain S-box-containing protein
MHWHYTPYILPVLLAALLSAALVARAWRYRAAPGAMAFVVMTLAVTGWLLGYAMWLMSDEAPAKLFWSKVEYVSIVALPLAWLVLALQYTGRREWLARRRLALLAVGPLITLLLVWTNEAHGLIWNRIEYYQAGSLMLADIFYGPWFWVHAGYSYLYLFLGAILIVLAVVRSSRAYRRQAVTLLIAVLIPWVGNVLYVFRLGPLPDLDWTPISFSFTSLVMAWGLFRFRLFDLAPVARDAVVEGMSDGMIVLDDQHRIVDLNPAAQDIIGVPAARAIGRAATQVLSPWPGWVGRFRDEVEAQAEITLGQGEARRHYDLRLSPLTDRRGRLTGRLMVLRDVTQRKQAEEALRQQTLELQARNKELDAFAATVAHDLKSPLAVIVGFAEILQEGCLTMQREDLARYLRTVYQNASKMRDIVDALLLLATVRRTEVQMEPLDMVAIVDEALQRLASVVEDHPGEIVVPESWPQALGYGPWIEEVWVNYIANALKYGGQPSRVELGATVLDGAEAVTTSSLLPSSAPVSDDRERAAPGGAQSGMVRFWVRDNGPGLTPEDQARLFTPFTQLDPRAPGHGLGLSIVRRIVEKLGGQVGVESEAGQGSVFSFTLPAP